MQKSEIRNLYLEKRRLLSRADLQNKSQVIADLFFKTTSLENYQIIHCFLPIEKFNEVSTWPIINRIWADYPQIKTATSITESDKLKHVLFDKSTTFIDDKWGIPTAQATQSLEIEKIDLVLVPLFAFDQRMHRVGYGKGLYDQFLAQCRTDTLKIGLSLFSPLDQEISDISPLDIALDKVIHPHPSF